MTAPNIELRQRPSVPLAVIRRRVRASELSRVVPECCGIVWNALRAQQLTGGRHVAVYWNSDIRLEVGVEFADAFVEQGDVVRSATPGGLTAFAPHFGPYGELGRTHEAIQRWCVTQGHKLAGPSWEVYGHWNSEWNDDSSQIRTDVFYLVTSP